MTRGWGLLLFGTILLLTLIGLGKVADAHKPGQTPPVSRHTENASNAAVR